MTVQIGLAVASSRTALVAVERGITPRIVSVQLLATGHQSPVAEHRKALAQAVSRVRGKKKQIVFSQPGERAQFLYAKLPRVDASQQSDLARYRLRDKLQAFENAAVAVLTVNQHEGVDEDDVLVIASQGDIIEARANLLSEAGLSVVGCETDAQAMLRVLHSAMSQRGVAISMKAITMVHIGLKTSRLVVIQDEGIRFIRSVRFGINQLVDYLSEQTPLSPVEIFELIESGKARIHEDFRMEIFHENQIMVVDAAPAFTSLISELRRLMNYYRSMSRSRSHGGILDQLTISGQLVSIEGFAHSIGHILSNRVVPLNPFAGIKLDLDSHSHHLVKHSPYVFLIATGLALSPYGLKHHESIAYGNNDLQYAA